MREVAPGVIEYGNPGTPAAIVPTVTMRQARLALLAAGKLHLVQPTIEELPEPEKTAAQITWEYSTEVQITHPLVQALAPALSLDEAGLVALFDVAAAL